MNSRLRRLLVPLLRSVHAGKPVTFRMRSAAEQALALVQRKPSPSRKKPAQERKAEKRAVQRLDDSALREAVFRRAGGLCELACGGTLAVELHHLEGGSGRKALQKVANCVAACWTCHRAFHHRPEDFREAVLRWCAAYEYPTPRRFLRPAPPASPTPPSGQAGERGKEGPQARAQRPHAHPGIPEDCYCVPALPPSEKEGTR